MLPRHFAASRARIASILVVLGIAASANAQNDTSRLHFEVRPQGAPASAWTTDLTVAPGTIVEFRALVTYTGTAQAVGLHGANFQPMVSSWNTATDVLQPFQAWGTSTVPTPPGWQVGGVNLDSGLYGRINPYTLAGITSNRALRGHTNLVSGVSYLRIAQSNATNWPGTGPTSGTAAANNYNGVSGLALGQMPPSLAGEAFAAATQNVEVARFAMLLGGMAQRTLVVNADPLSIGTLSSLNPSNREFSWYADLAALTSGPRGAVTIESAFIRVPTPGAIALMGMGGLLAARRRRA